MPCVIQRQCLYSTEEEEYAVKEMVTEKTEYPKLTLHPSEREYDLNQFFELYVNGKRTFFDICISKDREISYSRLGMKKWQRIAKDWKAL